MQRPVGHLGLPRNPVHHQRPLGTTLSWQHTDTSNKSSFDLKNMPITATVVKDGYKYLDSKKDVVTLVAGDSYYVPAI
jgi:hypothetical protein